MAQNIFRADPGALRHNLKERALAFAARIDGQHILLDIVFIPLVHRPVHVDGQARNHEQIPVHVHQAHAYPLLCADRQATGYGQGPVEPWSTEHPSVFLHVQLAVPALRLHLRVLFDLKRGRVAVAGHNVKARKIPFRNLKRDQRGLVAGHKVPAALF